MLNKDLVKQISIFSQKRNVSSGRDNRYIRGSSMGECSRKIGYMILGYEAAPETSHSYFTLDLGNAIHDMLQRFLVEMGWLDSKPFLNARHEIDWENKDESTGCEVEIIDHKRRVIGHVDGITVPLAKKVIDGVEQLVPDENGERYLIEIKSITDRPYHWCLGIRDGGTSIINEADYETEFIELDMEWQKSGKLQSRISNFQHSRKVRMKYGAVNDCPVYKVSVEGKKELVTFLMMGNSSGSFTQLKEPKQEHIAQASLYADSLGVKKILFIYVAKDTRPLEETILNTPMKIFEHEVSLDTLELIDLKINNVYENTDEGRLPPKEYDLEEDGSKCKWCPYAWQCWNLPVDDLNKQLLSVGRKPLIPGPGIKHEHQISLKEVETFK